MSTKDNVLKALSDKNQYLSGSQIAEGLGISRNAVWKAVKQLESDGFIIEAVPNKGYKLVFSPEIISAENISEFLSTSSIGRNITVFAEIDSTNNYAKSICQSVDMSSLDGNVIIAESQSAGRGRLGRTFCSPKKSGIYFSVILKPSVEIEKAPLITSASAVAVCEAIESVCGGNPRIKWINDIFMNGRKICGILTEASVNFESAALDYAIIGIGINTGSVKEVFDSELLGIASSIEDECGISVSKCRLIAEILNRLEYRLSQLENRLFMEDYRKYSCIIGERIAVIKAGSEREAVACDIDDMAGLIVKYDDGSSETLNSGEARIIRK